MIINKIKKNREAFKQGITDYLPHPKDMGTFSKIFPGRLRGDVTAITGGMGSAKSSLVRHLVFRTIEWAIKEGKDYKVLWFGLEESREQFEYSLLSWLVYRNSSGLIRYNIEHFEGLGKSIKDEDLPYIELAEKDFETFMERIIFHDLVLNSFGIYKEVRDYARKHGTFYNEGKALTDQDIANKEKWDTYKAKNPDEFVEVVVDHIGLLVPQKDERDVPEAMTNLMKSLRIYAAKMFRYSIVLVHQQALEMEDLDHVKEKYVYASIQGLGKLVAQLKFSESGEVHRG